MELVLGGVSAVGAAIFTNPLDVCKIRMQLQGELQSPGKYTVHYRNVFHAALTIASKDGLIAIQKGLVPALYYQFFMNGTRLGLYHLCDKRGLTKTKQGKVDPIGSILVACLAGTAGGFVGSPFYLVKTQLQSRANSASIAVGTQHNIKGMVSAFTSIYGSYGLFGLWRGMSSTLIRLVVVSAVQLPTFAKSREIVTSKHYFPEGNPMNAFIASLISGLFVSIAMAPFDLISTRFYNQGVDSYGRGLMYSSVLSCARKTYSSEGVKGFFKGWTAIYFRLGPHTLISLVIWDQLKQYHKVYQANKQFDQ